MRALVLSGGGSKGQYHVGALRALLCDAERHYEIIAGVSVGALVAAHLAQYRATDGVRAYDALARLFTPLRNADIYHAWRPFGLLTALWQPSLFDASPLRKLISTHLDPEKVRASGCKLRIGATSLATGAYRVFTEQDEDLLLDAVYASAAYPVAFAPARINAQWWSDGGVRSVTPIKAAIDAGATHIDIVMCSPERSEAGHFFMGRPTTAETAVRVVDLMSDQITADDLEKARLWNRVLAVDKSSGLRHIPFTVVRPAEAINRNSLHFDPAEARAAQELGYADACAALKEEE